ncbi:hypothetical protein K1T71_014069 [Dendrolimus kikuchii]|uniref:Uncharacterized protein n=1 Tax=Dendrolimus kikuchii TaxID=765133 RepID=A0ACC1CF08_9NEOP|nr:hypothetical protein K1T71_014069 [Dendrolimus kikuchii]
MAWTTAGSDRSGPMFAPRTRRSPSQAGHSCRVCNAVSSTLALQCWHPDDDSRPIRHRYRPKQPCPVSTCVWRNPSSINLLSNTERVFQIRPVVPDINAFKQTNKQALQLYILV